jgi:hypothetical protein
MPPPNHCDGEDTNKARDVDQQFRVEAKNSIDHIEKQCRQQRPQIDRRNSNHQGENKGGNPTQEKSEQKAPGDGAVNPRSEECYWTGQSRAGPSEVGVVSPRRRFVFRGPIGHFRLGTPERVSQAMLPEIMALGVAAVVAGVVVAAV